MIFFNPSLPFIKTHHEDLLWREDRDSIAWAACGVSGKKYACISLFNTLPCVWSFIKLRSVKIIIRHSNHLWIQNTIKYSCLYNNFWRSYNTCILIWCSMKFIRFQTTEVPPFSILLFICHKQSAHFSHVLIYQLSACSELVRIKQLPLIYSVQ